MQKNNPKTILERVYKAHDTIKKDSHLAKALGQPPRLVSEWKRRGNIPLGRIMEISEVLEIDLDYLLGKIHFPNGEGTIRIHDYRNDPVSEGTIALSEYPFNYTEWSLSFIKKFMGNSKINTKDYIQFPVSGDSMMPTLGDGGHVVAINQMHYTEDGIYVVQHDGNMYIRRLEKQGENFILKSDNKKYAPITISDTKDFSIIAKVLWGWIEL